MIRLYAVTQCLRALFLIITLSSLPLSFCPQPHPPISPLLRETTDHLGIEFMGKESFLLLHLHESRLSTSQDLVLEQQSAVWSLTYSTCIAHDTTCLIAYGIIRSFARGTTEPVVKTNGACMNVHIHTFTTIRLFVCMLQSIVFEIFDTVFISRRSFYAYVFLLTAPSLSLSFLSLPCSPSFFLSQLLMKCLSRIPMCCSLLGNSENREAGRVQ